MILNKLHPLLDYKHFLTFVPGCVSFEVLRLLGRVLKSYKEANLK